jgi:hypothetical protein
MIQFSARVELAVDIRCQVLRQPHVCVCLYWCIHTTAFACVYVCVIFYVWMPVTTCVCVRFQTCTSSYRHSPPFFLPCSVAYLDVSKLTTAVCVCVRLFWFMASAFACVYVCVNRCKVFRQPHVCMCMRICLLVYKCMRTTALAYVYVCVFACP